MKKVFDKGMVLLWILFAVSLFVAVVNWYDGPPAKKGPVYVPGSP